MASFHKQLVLNQWMYGFFNAKDISALKLRLGEDRYEGLEDDGQTKFFYELIRGLFNPNLLNEQILRRYDLNIVAHWLAITEQRNKLEGTVLNMKYFQYLSLLFTEIYLDWYFNKRQQLLDGLNEVMQAYNQNQPADLQFQHYDADELNKLAFWNATGSGKTLLLHVNIKQYLHYFQQGRDIHPDKIILLTPNEGLSNQHMEELKLSGFGFYRLFDKNRSGVFKGTIEIIDINKLGDDMGDKTVAVEAFEGNNLVLVDEGHRGTGTAAGAWMRRREALVKGGFAFEYSATFGQAVSSGWNVKRSEDEQLKKNAKMVFGTASLRQLDDDQKKQIALTLEDKRKAKLLATREAYAKCVLFDYSYKYFYEDGYGKESLILNLKDEAYANAKMAQQYFTACLLSFYQQQYLWATHQEKLADFNIEHPLWVFVGNTVSGEDSDILSVIKHFAVFLNEENQAKAWIKSFINNEASLLDSKGNNVFNERFSALMTIPAEIVYADILSKLFNANSRQRLKLINIKGAKGELLLKVGEAEPFGLINIGDDSGLFNEAESVANAALFDTEADDFGQSLFGTLNNKNSKLNVLIGSRKFTEGWSSWRVSTMGLLNMGKGEGSQIIQLFGRGVRLKGRAYSLKRTTPGQRPKGLHVERLETLNIFGVNAGYMATFKDYLREEGITPPDEMLQLDFKTKLNLPAHPLKTLALKDGYKDNQLKGFKRTHYPWLYEVPEAFAGKIKKPHVELDLYPKLEALATAGISQADGNIRNSAKIAASTMALFDFDRIYLSLLEFKTQRTWSNLRLDIAKLKAFCLVQNDWYTLYMPTAALQINTIADVKRQEDVMIRLLQDYTDRFYKTLKGAYEGQFYAVVFVQADDEVLLKTYHFDIEDTDAGLGYDKKIKELQTLITDGKINEAANWQAGQMVAICFDKHLYHPLFWDNETSLPLKMRPVVFDAPSEVSFVRDLDAYCKSVAGKAFLNNRSLYLLRNADNKAKGLGFATAGNFYPDFLLWIVEHESNKQWLTFIDPKGIRNEDLDGPKFQLHTEIKRIEQSLDDPLITLNAFILSATAYSNLINVQGKFTKEQLESRHLIFMDASGLSYLSKLFDRMN
jgi:hypothetical protein